MCSDGAARLVGGMTKREGRVEMCYNGVWGTVCANGWNDIAANIVCSQLGYNTNSSEFSCDVLLSFYLSLSIQEVNSQTLDGKILQ